MEEHKERNAKERMRNRKPKVYGKFRKEHDLQNIPAEALKCVSIYVV